MNIDISNIQSQMATSIDRVVLDGDRIIIRRRGKDIAAIVPIEDLYLLEKLDDEACARSARKVLAKMKRKKLKPIPWARVKTELGL